MVHNENFFFFSAQVISHHLIDSFFLGYIEFDSTVLYKYEVLRTYCIRINPSYSVLANPNNLLYDDVRSHHSTVLNQRGFLVSYFRTAEEPRGATEKSHDEKKS